MNLSEAFGPARRLVFRVWRRGATAIPGGTFASFGPAGDQIGEIAVINLDRQPHRWQRIQRELYRFRSSDGARLTAMTRRFAAVDARDGRSVAATGDVDPNYEIGDQLFVQPDVRLASAFRPEQPVRMTRQEVAVARSHIEIWKQVAEGSSPNVLVLEDDAWFKPRARKNIDRGWRAAVRDTSPEAPLFVYLSYEDAGGTAVRVRAGKHLFRPAHGLWLLSGYVLSREAASALLRAMPVRGPVDLWINYRFAELGALALNRPVIEQRKDIRSENSYSVMPFLARAGVVDGRHRMRPTDHLRSSRVVVWCSDDKRESLAMALSMLGLRVRVFETADPRLDSADLGDCLGSFDALINPRLDAAAARRVLEDESAKVAYEAGSTMPAELLTLIPSTRTVDLAKLDEVQSWKWLCQLLTMIEPVDDFPLGPPADFGLFRVGEARQPALSPLETRLKGLSRDESPWTLPASRKWQPVRGSKNQQRPTENVVEASMSRASIDFSGLTETFPGNLASFAPGQLIYGVEGLHLKLEVAASGKGSGTRRYISGAIVSRRSQAHGRFEAEIRAATGSGVVTGFFLHRSAPRQEIDIEFLGSDPRHVLTNVFFNPGDDGSAFDFGYRGSPCRVDLGFDSSEDFHHYAIEWEPGHITWFVDGRVVHQRMEWDPTPIPHLPMRLHANLWVPRSQELAGRIESTSFPNSATFKNVQIHRWL